MKIFHLGMSILFAAASGMVFAAEVFAPNRFTVLNIVPCVPGREDVAAADAVRYVEATGNDVVLYSLTLHPEGRPALQKVDRLLASYRAFASKLKGTRVRPGILLQAILGHWPRTDKDVEPWTRTVNISGAAVRFCPLDPGFRAYIRTVAERLAREKPCFILSDDDVRAYSHEAECFCPLHAAIFSERMGKTYTPEAYRQAVRTAKAGDKAWKVFYDLQKEMTLGVASLLREGIDAIDPSIPSGVCSATEAVRIVGDEAKCMAGTHHPPVFRVNNALYMENSPKALTTSLKHTMGVVALYPDIPYILDESDTFPHNLWSKAAIGVHAKLVAGIFAGLKGSKLWYCGMHKRGDPVSENYTRIFARYRGCYNALVAELAGSAPCGLLEPLLKDETDWHPLTKRVSVPYETGTWTDGYAGVMGVPFEISADSTMPGVWTLSGARMVNRLSDAEIGELLRHPVLMDSLAAAALEKRGFAALTGVKIEGPAPLFNQEISADGRTRYAYSFESASRLVPAKGAAVLSDLAYRAYEGAPETERVAPGSVYFENAQGGRVIVSVFSPRVVSYCRYNEQRKAQFESFLSRLNGGPLPAVVANEQDVLAFARRKPNGQLVVGAVNLNFDAMETLDIRVARVPKSVERLCDDGTWTPVVPEVRGPVIRLPLSLPCYGSAVVRLTD